MEVFKLLGTIAINNSDANEAIDDTTGKAEASEGKMSAAFKKIGAAVATFFAVDKIKSFGIECINMASDVQEVQNKFDVVFQGMTDDVEDWAATFADSIGRNKNTIKTYLADNQNMFVGMGMTREEGAKLSEQMVELGLDLASFNNLQEDEAVNALSKALMGETESAKRLGAVLNENTLAMAQEQLGYQGKFKDLTEAQKMEVRYQAILNQSADAVGDCARSLDSYKGRQIQAQSAMENLKETIGTRLIPVMTNLTAKFGGLVTKITAYVNPAFDKIDEVASNIGIYWRGVLQPAIADVGDALLEVWDAFKPVIQSFTDMLPKTETNVDAMDIFKAVCWDIKDALGWLTDKLKAVADWISNHQTAVEVMVTILGSVAAAVLLVNGAVSAWNAVATIATTVTTGLGTAVTFLTSPMGIAIMIITALIAIGVLLYQNWDTIKAKCSELVAAVSERFAQMKESVSATVANIRDTLTSIWESIKTTVTTIVTSLWSSITGLFNSIKTTISTVVTSISDGISNGFTAAKDTALNVFNALKSGIENVFNGIWSVVRSVVNSILGGIETMCNGVVSGINVLLGGIEKVANAAGEVIGLDPISLSLSSVSLPRLAQGGVLAKGQVGLLEGDGAEAVVPLERNRAWISKVSDEFRNQGMGSNGEVLESLNEIISLLTGIGTETEDLPETMKNAFGQMQFKVNNREFARLVKTC